MVSSNHSLAKKASRYSARLTFPWRVSNTAMLSEGRPGRRTSIDTVPFLVFRTWRFTGYGPSHLCMHASPAPALYESHSGSIRSRIEYIKAKSVTCRCLPAQNSDALSARSENIAR
jgi:hypothetical protein